MKLKRFNYNEEATVNLYSVQDIVKEKLSDLEMFLKHIRSDIPNSIDDVIDSILSQYGETKDYEFLLETEYELLKEYPELLDKSKNTILSLLNYSKYQNNPVDEKIEVNVSDVIRSDTVFGYYQINSLLAIMPRERAIKFYKDFIDHSIQQRRDPRNYMENVDGVLRLYKIFFRKWKIYDAIIGKLDENSVIGKITRCSLAEILKDFDSELNYTLVCYGEFETTKNRNPNFILTRTQTLMQGAEYCDYCVSDTRFKKEIKHPSIEFWDKI